MPHFKLGSLASSPPTHGRTPLLYAAGAVDALGRYGFVSLGQTDLNALDGLGLNVNAMKKYAKAIPVCANAINYY
jgi:hypothetical protein